MSKNFKYKSLRLAIDVGGTFIDIVAYDWNNKKIINLKSRSDLFKIEDKIIELINEILKLGYNLKNIELMFYVTTVGSNLILGQFNLKFPKTCLITTKGFRDIIEIGRQNRPELYNIFFEKVKPIIERKYRFVVEERIDSKGKIIKELNYEELKEISKTIVKEKIKSVAIGFINSYLNPVHEIKAKNFLKKILPKDVFIVNSYETCPEYREYERISTTCLNALLMPIITKHLKKLKKKIKIKLKIYIMSSSGGLLPSYSLIKKPVLTLESGPIAGVIGSSLISKNYGIKNSVSFDMGGTTAKVSLIVNGNPYLTTEYEFNSKRIGGRIIKGSGYPIKFPFIDVLEVSAGGGTVIWVDETNSLRVGPYSAGSNPGPACYGKSNLPTITDANLVLGRLNPKYLLGGKMPIFKEKAFKSLEKVSKKIHSNVIETSLNSIKIINFKMAKAIRMITIERGIDVRNLTLIAFGGAGPMHACELANEIGIRKILIPLNPGLFSSFSLLFSNIKYTYVKSFLKKIEETSIKELNEKFKKIEEKAIKDIKKEKIKRIIIEKYLDMRYKNQSYEIFVPIKNLKNLENIKKKFYSFHKKVYGWYFKDPVEIVNLRLISNGILSKPKLKIFNEKNMHPLLGEREVYFEYNVFKVKVLDRKKLKVNDEILGPAIIEQYDSTIVIPPNYYAKVDDCLNIIINKE